MWILFALTSAIILASRKIQEKKLVSSIGGVMGWMIRAGSVAVALLLWIVFSRNIEGIASPALWWVLLYCVFAYPLLIILYYRAMAALPFSLFGMMAPIVPVTSLIANWIIFGHAPSPAGFVGIGAISIAIVILFWKHERKEIAMSSLISAVLSYMIMGFGSVLDKVAMMQVSSSLYTLLNQTTALLSLLFLSYFYYGGLQIHFYKNNFRVLSIIGVIQGIGYLLVMTAIALAPSPGYVVALSNTHAIITSIYGVTALSEKVTYRKIFAFLFMLVALISFAFA